MRVQITGHAVLLGDRLLEERHRFMQPSSGSAQLKRRKPWPAGPKHSPPRQATPFVSSAPSSRYIARPCDVMPKRLQIGGHVREDVEGAGRHQAP